jgi:hypothetical protein
MSAAAPAAPPAAAPATPRPGEVTKSWMAGLGQVEVPPADANPDAPAAPPGPPAAPAAPKPPGQQQPPAPPAPPPDPEPAAKPDETKWPRSAQEWKKFREEREREKSERDAKIKTLEEELTGWKGKASSLVDPKEVDSIKKERDALSERLRVVSVTEHPKFKAYFKNKTDSQLALAKRIAGQDRAEEVEKILTMPDGEIKTQKLEELLAEMPAIKQMQFGGVINELDRINLEREQEIAKAGETYEQMVASEQKAGEERRQTLEKVFTGAVERMGGKDGVAIFQMREGDEAWNSAVKSRIEAAKSILFSQQDPERLVEAALHATAFKPLLQALQFSVAEAAKLTSQVKELTEASPTIQPSGQDNDTDKMPATPEPKAGSRPMEVAAGWMKGLPKIR